MSALKIELEKVNWSAN